MNVTEKCKAHKVAMFRKDAPPADLCSFQLQSLAPFLSLLCITAATQEMLTVVKMQHRMPSNIILVGINEPVALHTVLWCVLCMPFLLATLIVCSTGLGVWLFVASAENMYSTETILRLYNEALSSLKWTTLLLLVLEKLLQA